MNVTPPSVQPDTEPEVIAVENSPKLLRPSCDCVERVNDYLRPLNGRVGTRGTGIGATPIVFVRRLAFGGIDPPVLLPRFCPFCGDPFEGQAPRAARPAAKFDFADAPPDFNPVEAAVFTLLRTQQRTALEARAMVRQAKDTDQFSDAS